MSKPSGLRSSISYQTGGAGVHLQGLIEISLLHDNRTPQVASGWHRYWCVLAGCCVYLYSSPQSQVLPPFRFAYLPQPASTHQPHQ